jgi:ComF family protein
MFQSWRNVVAGIRVPLSVDFHQFCGWARDAARAKLPGMFESGAGIVNQLKRLRLTGPRAWSRLLAATLFPPRCCLCGFAGASLDLDLCQHCHADLPWDHDGGGVVSALIYEHPIDEMIRQLKYQGVIAHARVFGALLAQAVRARGGQLPRLLLPVPLHPARFCERGFNQAAAIARFTGQLLEIPVAGYAVRRLRDTPSQTALGVTERHLNVRDAFGLRGPRALGRLVEAAHVAVLDDVTTTGSTLGELRRVLLGAGVRRVDCWAVARAP